MNDGVMKHTVCSCINQCPQCGMCCQHPCPHRGGGPTVTWTDSTIPSVQPTKPMIINPVEPEEFRINAAYERGYKAGFNDGFDKGKLDKVKFTLTPTKSETTFTKEESKLYCAGCGVELEEKYINRVFAGGVTMLYCDEDCADGHK